jgi:hypothetical protein
VAISASEEYNLVLVAPPFLKSYESWRANQFTPQEQTDPLISGYNADPDGDGICNLLEYAFHLTPKVAGRDGLPLPKILEQNGKRYLGLIYTRLKSVPDIDYTVEISENLQIWNPVTSDTTQVSVTDNPDGLTQTVVVRDLTPIDNAPYRFMRLKVTKQ